MPMSNGYNLYKPLRNVLRQYNLWSGLFVAYRYMLYLDYDKELPPELKPRGVITKHDRLRKGLAQWEFETLIREMILNCPERGGKRFESIKDVSRCINHIKRIENEVYGAHDGEQDDVLFELVRIAHRQFPWQNGINQPYVARYHWLYRQKGLSEQVESLFGMTITELMQISLSLTGHFLNNFLINRPIKNKINGVPELVTESYIQKLSIDVSSARESYGESASYDINWAYTFNIFREKPLLIFPNGQVACLIPDFLIRRVTSGLYYDLVKVKDLASNHLGPAVQELVGHSILAANDKQSFMIREEMSYGTRKNKKDSIDWILSDRTGHLFVECKAARIRFRGMSDLRDREQIRKEFDRIRAFALQSYRTISDALDGKYSHWQPNGKPCFLAIVTMEDWQSFGLHIEREVMQPLFRELEELGIDPNLPKVVPMTFCAIADFEAALEVCKTKGISTLFERKQEGEYRQWALGTYVATMHMESLGNFEPRAFRTEWGLIDPN